MPITVSQAAITWENLPAEFAYPTSQWTTSTNPHLLALCRLYRLR